MPTRVLIADKFPDAAVTTLQDLGCEVAYEAGWKDEELVGGMATVQPEVLIVRSTKVNAAAIDAAGALKVVIRAGAGYNTIDVDAASRKSVYVANCPGKNAVAVAELAMGLIMSIDRRIPENVADLKKGVWNKAEYSKADGIAGKKLGIIGTGRIGREVITRAKAFGMTVYAWSRSLTPEGAQAMGVVFCKTPLECAGAVDIVSVHLAMTPDTKEMIGTEFFEALRPGAWFVNTSRAEVVDEAALAEAVDTRGIKAGLDVFHNEPGGKSGEFVSELAQKPGVYGTHHIGASTEQAQSAVAEETVRIVTEYMATGAVPNCVNLMLKTPAQYLLSIRHKNTVGILADVLDVVREEKINVERMENIIFKGAEGACANIQIDTGLSDAALQRIERSSPHIYSVSITAMEE
ncbi:MAG: NAD(P)-binding domain-containing protein [Spirochaetales bacterium]|nr:NAD(P)-binding domain-containing protein [Spirochaetales bacterium]